VRWTSTLTLIFKIFLSDGKAEQMKISNHGAPSHRHRYGADLAIRLRVTGMDLRLID
jgi:hypothetical protein